jgi:hypothetical protein
MRKRWRWRSAAATYGWRQRKSGGGAHGEENSRQWPSANMAAGIGGKQPAIASSHNHHIGGISSA